MALKRQITKAEHAALVPALQVEYKVEGEGYVLDAIGFDDAGELRRAKDREVEARKEADAKVLALTTEVTALKAIVPEDVASLEKSWKKKVKEAEAAGADKIAERDKQLESLLVDAQAVTLAAELSGENAAIILPHIKARLRVEQVEGGMPITRVVDKEGKKIAGSITDLAKEFREDARFKSVIIASRGSGGGAAGSAGGGGGAPANGNKKFGELNDAERTQMFKDNPTAFEQASQAHQQEMREAATKVQRVF